MKFINKSFFRLLDRVECQKGIALITVLLALSILTLIGLTMTFVSTTETLVNRNTAIKVVNLYAAESAAEEARGRIKSLLDSGSLSRTNPSKIVYIVSDSSIDPTSGGAESNPYFDTDDTGGLSVTRVTSDLTQLKFAWVKIVPKTELRANYDLDGNGTKDNNPVRYGYNTLQPNAKPSQYVNSGSKPANYVGSPVYLVKALASNNAGYKQLIRADISGIPLPPLKAALYSKDAISMASNTVHITGDDENGALKNLNGVESQGNITGDMTHVNGSPLQSNPNSAFSYNIDSLIKTFKPPASRIIEKVAPAISKAADGTYVGEGLNFGKIPSEGNMPEATFADGPLNISNSTGQGILVVRGNLSVTGSFIYYGLIVVRGKVSLNGGALSGIEIHGAIISSSVVGDQTSLLTGNVKILNNSFFLSQEQFENFLQYRRLAHREIFK